MWHGILENDHLVEQFRRAIARGRLGSSFLFAGPAGIGKRRFAVTLAQGLLCSARPEVALDPCGQCAACAQVLAGTHPDLEIVTRPADKAFLPLELLIGDKEHRMRRGLCHHLAMKPFMGGRRLAIIDDADYLNAEGANSLLKTLEEPPPRSVLILISTSPAKQLPTIRSRCQLIRFRPLSTETVATILVQQGLVSDPTQAARLAAHSGGSVQRALELTDEELWNFRGLLFARLAVPLPDSVRLTAALGPLVDQSVREAAARRARLRQVIGFAAEFYEHLIRALCGAGLPEDAELRGPLSAAVESWPGDALLAAACLERCLKAAEQVDRNANQTTLLECWLDDLARIIGTRTAIAAA